MVNRGNAGRRGKGPVVGLFKLELVCAEHIRFQDEKL